MPKPTLQHRVRKIAPGTTLTDYCQQAIPLLGSRTAVKKAVHSKRLLLNGRPARLNDPLQTGDQLTLTGTGLPKARKFEQEIPVVWEDSHLIVVNKPAGIAVNGDRIRTLENALAGSVEPSGEPDALPRPVAVHRIDLPTQGLVLLAKTKQALMAMSQAFEHNKVHKQYIAVVHGRPAPQGTTRAPLQGKPAETKWECRRTVPSRDFGHLSLLELSPVTGRTHQLRLHMQKLGHLIVGDKQYAGPQKTVLNKGLMLCACYLSFQHPTTQKPIAIKILPPPKFEKLLDREEAWAKKQ